MLSRLVEDKVSSSNKALLRMDGEVDSLSSDCENRLSSSNSKFSNASSSLFPRMSYSANRNWKLPHINSHYYDNRIPQTI